MYKYVYIADILADIFPPRQLKYWGGVQHGQSYLMKRRCFFSFS